MKNVRTKLAKSNPYYISDYRRKELKYFCLQYHEMKSYLTSISMGKGSSEWDDPTGNEAIRRLKFKQSIDLIEKVAMEVGGDYGKHILKAVTEDLSYTYLSTHYDDCYGRSEYYERYHKFWYVLSQEKQFL